MGDSATAYYAFKNGAGGYDTSFLGLDRAPSPRFTSGVSSPGLTRRVTTLSCVNLGQPPQTDPRRAWNGVVQYVNERITPGGYLGTYDDGFLSITSNDPGYSNDLLNFLNGDPDGNAITLTELTKSQPWTKSNIIQARDAIRLVCPYIQFAPIPRVWSQSVVTDLLQQIWIETYVTDSIPGESGTVEWYSISDCMAGYEGGGEPCAYIGYDLGNGYGQQYAYWPADIADGQTMLDLWAEMDRFVDEEPTPRGSIFDFTSLFTPTEGPTADEVVLTVTFYGDVPPYLPNFVASKPSGSNIFSV